MADLKLEIKENITLEGVQRGSLHTVTLNNINNVDNRTLTAPSGSEITLFSLSDTEGAGTFVTSSLKYARITNHSTTVPINLKISSSTENYSVSIDTEGSYFLTTSKLTGSSDVDFNYDDIVDLKVEPSSSDAKVEYFIATS